MDNLCVFIGFSRGVLWSSTRCLIVEIIRIFEHILLQDSISSRSGSVLRIATHSYIAIAGKSITFTAGAELHV